MFPLVSNRPLFRGDGLYDDKRKSRNGGSIGTGMLKLRTDERIVMTSSAKRNSKWSYCCLLLGWIEGLRFFFFSD